MTTPRDPDAILSAWLEEGPDQLPDATRRAIAVSTRTTRETRHAIRLPWRINPMSPISRIALAAAAIVAVMGGALYLISPGSQEVGGDPPTSSPQPEATSPLVSGDASFTSSRYGFLVVYPGELRVQPSASDWKYGAAVEVSSSFLDRFTGNSIDPDLQAVFVGIASQPLPAGMTADAWMTGHAERNRSRFGDACGGLPGDWQPISVAGAVGRRVLLDCGDGPDTVSEIVFTYAGRGWAISGDTPIVDEMLPSFRLPAAQGTVPTEWTTWTSSRFAYSIDHPTDWAVTPATRDWTGGGLSPDGANQDRFGLSPTSTRVIASSIPLVAGDDGGDKIAELDRINEAIACQLSGRHDITLDGVRARQEDFSCLGTDYGIEVVVASGGRFYQIDLFSQTPIGDTDRATFDVFLASFRFLTGEASVPVAWTTYTSSRFAYSIDYPADWVVTPATADWAANHHLPFPDGPAVDRFGASPDGDTYVFATSDPLGPDQVAAERIAQVDFVNAGEGSTVPACLTSDRHTITLGGVDARQEDQLCFQTDNLIEVVVVHDGRFHMIDLFSKSPISEASRATFDRFLASFRFSA